MPAFNNIYELIFKYIKYHFSRCDYMTLSINSNSIIIVY